MRRSAAVLPLVLAASGWLAPPPAPAESGGTIVGRVFDGKTGAPLSFVPVLVRSVPSRWGASTDHQGRFVISDVPGGAWEVVVTPIGRDPVSGSVAVGTEDTTSVSMCVDSGADTLSPAARRAGPRAPFLADFPRVTELEGEGLLHSWYSAEFPRGVGFTADGSRLVLETLSGLAVYRARDRRLLRDHVLPLPPPGPVDLARFFGRSGLVTVQQGRSGQALVSESDAVLEEHPVERFQGAFPRGLLDHAFDAERRRLVLWGEGAGRPTVWEVAGGRRLGTLPTRMEVRCAAFPSDSSLVILGGAGPGPVLEIWDLDGPRLRAQVIGGGSGEDVHSLAVDPGGRLVFTGNADQSVSCRELRELSARWRQAPAGCCAGDFLDLSPDGSLLVTGLGSGLVFMDSRSGKVVRKISTNHPRGIRAAVFAPDGETLATIGYDSRLALWAVDRILAARP